ncbi:hypothetical protein FRB95_007441 [Tulasnella sp. JGI-2019a]|nr:hypothetical protein FRB95_007441 [Tulasnella sp. JGI-2019a]
MTYDLGYFILAPGKAALQAMIAYENVDFANREAGLARYPPSRLFPFMLAPYIQFIPVVPFPLTVRLYNPTRYDNKAYTFDNQNHPPRPIQCSEISAYALFYEASRFIEGPRFHSPFADTAVADINLLL